MSAVVVINGYAAPASCLDDATAALLLAQENALSPTLLKPLAAKGLTVRDLAVAYARAHHHAYGKPWNVWVVPEQLGLFGGEP